MIMKLKTALTAITALAVTTSLALAAPGGLKIRAGVLVDANNMTLYTFDKDAPGTSNCYDQCAINWPPAIAPSGAKAQDGFSIVTRKDGTTQWAYGGQPLYLWVNDAKPGDKTGDGVGGVWHIIPNKAAPASTSSSSSGSY